MASHIEWRKGNRTMCATHPPFTRWISSHTRHSMSLHDRAQTQKMHKIQIWLSLNVNCIDFNFDVRTLTVQKSWWWGNRSCSWHNTHTYIFKLKMVECRLPEIFLFLFRYLVLFLRTLHTIAICGASRRYAQSHLALSLWSLRQMHSLTNESVSCSLSCIWHAMALLLRSFLPTRLRRVAEWFYFLISSFFRSFYVCLSTTDQI